MDPIRAALEELLRLYDWRNELGQIQKGPDYDQKWMDKCLNRYGREKKVAWQVARQVLVAPEVKVENVCYTRCNKHGGTVSFTDYSKFDRVVCMICGDPPTSPSWKSSL